MHQWVSANAWLSKRENLLFIILIAIHLLPIWLFNYFASQDGPCHIYNAKVLQEYYSPEGSLFREYYVINYKLIPNWFSHLALAGLMHFTPPLVAEKIFLSSYVIFLPTSVRYALYAIRPSSTFLAVLAFPFVYNLMLHMGFYNFSYGLPLFFLIFGYWLRNQKNLTMRHVFLLSILWLFLYFCHPVSLITTYIAIAISIGWQTLFDLIMQLRKQKGKFRFCWSVYRNQALIAVCALFPSLILLIIFAIQREGNVEIKDNTYYVPLWKQGLQLLSIFSIPAYDRLGLVFSIVLGFVFIALLVYFLRLKIRQRQIQRWDGLLAIAIAFTLLYFLAPNSMFGGGQLVSVNRRLLFYPFFVLIIWLGSQLYSNIMQWRIQIIATIIALGLLGINSVKYTEINNYLQEYVSETNLIAANSILLTYCIDQEKCLPNQYMNLWQTSPFLLASGYVTMQKHSIDLNNYQGILNYFPLRFRPEFSPQETLPKQGQGTIDTIDRFQKIGKQINYIAVWGSHEVENDTEQTKAVFRQLQQKYELIYKSPQRGLMQLYRLKN